MNRKTFMVFPLIVFCIMFAFLAIIMLNNNSLKKMASADKIKQLKESCELIAKRDITIYWAGEFPKEMSALKDKTVLLSPGKMTSDIMPVKTLSMTSIEYDKDGRVISASYHRDYTDDLMIVVNQETGLTESDIEIIRQCITANNVPILIIGKGPITEIRKAMYKIYGSFDENDSLFYTFDGGFEEHIIGTDIVKEGGIPYYQALADRIMKYCQDKDKAAEEALSTTETSEMTTTSSSAPETAPDSSETSSSEESESVNGMDILRGETQSYGY